MSTTIKIVLAVLAAVIAFIGFVFGVNRSKKLKKYTPKTVRTFCLKTEKKTVSGYKSSSSALDQYFSKKKDKASAVVTAGQKRIVLTGLFKKANKAA